MMGVISKKTMVAVCRIKLNVTLAFEAKTYFLTFHMAFKTWIRGENCVCSCTAVFYEKRNVEMYLEFNIEVIKISISQIMRITIKVS